MTKEILFVLGVFIFVVVILFYLVNLAYEHDSKECAKKKGHLVTVYKSSLCVTADGRILE